MANNEFVLNEEIDTLLFGSYNKQFMDVVVARANRRGVALRAYVNSQYPEVPMESLEELQMKLNRLQELPEEPENIKLQLKIQEIQNKIDNNEYCATGTTEYNTRQAYITYREAFQWPSEAELTIRADEEKMLLALLESSI